MDAIIKPDIINKTFLFLGFVILPLGRESKKFTGIPTLETSVGLFILVLTSVYLP